MDREWTCLASTSMLGSVQRRNWLDDTNLSRCHLIWHCTKRQAGKCELCELNFRYGDTWEVDHVIPTSRGGKDVYSNLQLLHRHCHDSKSATDRDVCLENWDDNPF
ncbi:HNH endonuclease [Coleofasciculus sp. H7-2]|uniref:HNH endonuclease n=1 Tax=Coleofasciculus sp. H7-2 TaxID=3351545 RepID=UPI0036704727